MKIDGRSWRNFYNDNKFWGCAYHVEEKFKLNGNLINVVENTLDTDIIEIIGGKVYETEENLNFDEPPSLEEFFLKWQKIKKMDESIIVICECNSLCFSKIIKSIEENGGKILNKVK
jgi:hypothetical protein